VRAEASIALVHPFNIEASNDNDAARQSQESSFESGCDDCCDRIAAPLLAADSRDDKTGLFIRKIAPLTKSARRIAMDMPQKTFAISFLIPALRMQNLHVSRLGRANLKAHGSR
jgi:hypothetical protein